MMERLNLKAALGLTAVLVAILLGLLLPQCRFNWVWHNDEPTKIIQIQSREWNLRHPPMLVTLTSFLSGEAGRQNQQRIAEIGRCLSALGLALMLASAVLLVWFRAGAVAGIAAGLLLILQPDFFEIGHYFKEDTLFLGGWMFCWLALFWVEQEPGRRPLWLAALALALVVSSKFVGWLMLPVIVAGLWRLRGGEGLKREGPGPLLLFLVLTLWWNYPLLVHWQWFCESMNDEIVRLQVGDYGVALAHPVRAYWDLLWQQVPSLFIYSTVLYLLYGLWRRSFKVVEWAMLFYLLVYAGGLTRSAKYSDRYMLPVTLGFYLAGLYGPLLMLRDWLQRGVWVRRVLQTLALSALMGFALWFKLPQWLSLYDGFRHDARLEMADWMKKNLPPNVLVAEDGYVKLEPKQLGGRPVVEDLFVADLGSLEDLRAQGVTHVIISYDVYHRFVDGLITPKKGEEEEFNRRRDFYQGLLRSRGILWQEPKKSPVALHPGLTLVDINKN